MKNEQYETEEEFVPRTMTSIIYEKYLDQLERASLDKILDVSGRIAVGVTLSTALVLGNELGAVLSANNFAIPKVAGCLLFGWYKRPIFSAVLYARERFTKALEMESRPALESGAPEIEAPTSLLIDGVTVEKLAEAVFASKAWKRDDAGALGIGRTKSEAIGKGLEKIGALVRGPNNSKVLFEGYRLEDLLTVFTNYATTGEFTATPLPSPVSGTGFSITPLKNEL